MLDQEDFAAFFEEVHGHEPFPWQVRLLRHVVEHHGEWPATLDLPTGSGKTAAMDIAVFHLALEAERGESRCAPVRIAFVVDRRLVVDDAFERAKKLAHALSSPRTPTATKVAAQLQRLAGDGPALVARRLRGGIPREDDWARTPSQPTILCSTVDQVGSRLLFRGYGISDSMKPIHAGLLGSDCLLLLDEAHLAEPFRQTLEWVRTYRGPAWREASTAAPWCVSLLTATPGETARDPFSLEDDDRAHPILQKRLEASKPTRLVPPISSERRADTAGDDDDQEREGGGRESSAKDLALRASALVDEVLRARQHFENSEHGVREPAIGVVVNRVARARAVFERLRTELAGEIAKGALDEPILLIGPARPLDRDRLAQELAAIRTRTWRAGEQRDLGKPIIIVATQCIEAGVDIDLDALITEHAPLDALRQRFGRLNRSGRDIIPYAAVVTMKADIASRYEDPVYGATLKPAWEAMKEAAAGSGANVCVDFGISAFVICMHTDTLAVRADAPVLLPAHLDLLSQTSPIPTADPDLALFLHGPRRQPDAVTVVWRADIDRDRQDDDETRRLLTLVPPRSAEVIELPVWAVRGWLERTDGAYDQLADVAAAAPEEERNRWSNRGRPAFLWKGDDQRSRWISPEDLGPGDTIVVPTSYGGADRFGWNPNHTTGRVEGRESSTPQVTDVGRDAALPFAHRRFAVRVAPGLVGDTVSEGALAEALANSPASGWRTLVDALVELPLPESLRRDLELLRRLGARDVVPYLDLYGDDEEGRRRGVVFVASRGIKQGVSGNEANTLGDESASDAALTATEDEAAGSLPGFALDLETHNRDVAEKALVFARASGLSEDRARDLELAGELHDIGKSDPRFQSWLHYGDPLGPDPDAPEQLLAKSGRRLPRKARADSGLPDHWRHEALSVRLAVNDARLGCARDPDLVLWLIGAHHGYGRPLFPHCDPTERVPEVGPQSLSFDWCGLDWSSLFARLKSRYGIWELARMESILRLADHRASEMRATEDYPE